MKRNIFVLFLHWIRLIKIVSKQTKRERLIYEPQTHCSKKMKVFVKDFFINCDQIGSFPRIWSHLLKNFLMEKIHFLCSVSNAASLSLNFILLRRLKYVNGYLLQPSFLQQLCHQQKLFWTAFIYCWPSS